YIVEQLNHSRAFKERAEQNEKEDVGCRYVDRHAIESLCPVRQMADDLIEVVAAMIERCRQILPEEPIEQAGAAHQRQRQPHHAPRSLEDQNNEERADNE